MKAAIDDSIMIKGQKAQAGSKILENFISPYNATVVEKLQKADIEISNRTKTDEFAIGRIFENGNEEILESAECVAKGKNDFALCNDFSGKVRRQASLYNMCYIHPTYGTVSRYGLIASVSSMDQIGVLAKSADEGFKVLSVIAGHDKNDGTSIPKKNYIYEKKQERLRAAIILDSLKIAGKDAADAIKNFGVKFDADEIEFPYFGLFPQVFYILSSAEIYGNLTRYDGVKFGFRAEKYRGINDLYVNTRTEGFGKYAKLSSVMGAYVLSKEHYDSLYLKSMGIRRLIKEYTDKLFKKYDILLMPASFYDTADRYKESALYALAGLAGLPALSFSHKGQGLQVFAKAGNENALYTAWEGGK